MERKASNPDMELTRVKPTSHGFMDEQVDAPDNSPIPTKYPQGLSGKDNAKRLIDNPSGHDFYQKSRDNPQEDSYDVSNPAHSKNDGLPPNKNPFNH